MIILLMRLFVAKALSQYQPDVTILNFCASMNYISIEFSSQIVIAKYSYTQSLHHQLLNTLTNQIYCFKSCFSDFFFRVCEIAHSSLSYESVVVVGQCLSNTNISVISPLYVCVHKRRLLFSFVYLYTCTWT